MILIGLGYKARQGKNYVANYMKEQDPSIKFYAFADELKLYCKENHDRLLPLWQLANQTKQQPACKDDPIYGYTPILQWYGTDVARKQNPNCWVEALDARLKQEAPEIAVITDVRFPNEAAYIKEKGGYLVEVTRLKEDGTQFLDTTRDPKHPSETALENYPYWDFVVLCKDGDLLGLKRKAVGVLNIVKMMDADAFSLEELTKEGFNINFVDEGGDFDESAYLSLNNLDTQGDGFKA